MRRRWRNLSEAFPSKESSPFETKEWELGSERESGPEREREPARLKRASAEILVVVVVVAVVVVVVVVDRLRDSVRRGRIEKDLPTL